MFSLVKGKEMKWLIFEEKYILCLKRFRWMYRIYKIDIRDRMILIFN